MGKENEKSITCKPTSISVYIKTSLHECITERTQQERKFINNLIRSTPSCLAIILPRIAMKMKFLSNDKRYF
jgi:hypothetical protein